nr:hypothetical protein [Tissierella sp.]
MLESTGFKDITIVMDPVTDEYARKWGYGLEIKRFIASAAILAYK